MPEPEALVFMLLSVGLALAALVTLAISRKRMVALTGGCLLVLLASPGVFLAFRWVVYGVTRPGPGEIRAALPGEWVGEGLWAGDRLVIGPELTVVQTIQRADGTRLEHRGHADTVHDDLGVLP